MSTRKKKSIWEFKDEENKYTLKHMTEEDASITVGAFIGACIAGPVGAGVGALVGVIATNIAKKIKD